jgi:hypothetical protein
MRKIVFKSFNKKDFVKDWLIPDLQKTIDGNLDTLMTLEVSTEET